GGRGRFRCPSDIPWRSLPGGWRGRRRRLRLHARTSSAWRPRAGESWEAHPAILASDRCARADRVADRQLLQNMEGTGDGPVVRPQSPADLHHSLVAQADLDGTEAGDAVIHDEDDLGVLDLRSAIPL